MWGIITFLFGFLYGWISPGRQSKSALMMNGLWIGLIVALVFLFIGLFANAPALGLGGGFGIFVTIVLLTLVFILGAWLGDLVETGFQRRRSEPRV
jgi:fatty acid desaturase